MTPRMSNPSIVLPDTAKATYTLWGSVLKSTLPKKTVHLVHLRVSQINGCSYCVDSAPAAARKDGETDQRLFAVAAWRDAPFFTEAERAALAISEAVTRLSDRDDPVSDAVWEEATRHYNEQELAALLIAISTVNIWNRLNVATRQVAGAHVRWDS